MLPKKIKVGFINWYSPDDKKALSGTPHKIAELLQVIGCEIQWVQVKTSSLHKIYSSVMRKISKLFPQHNVIASHTVWGARLQSKTIDRNVVEGCDLLFAPVASECLYALETDKPIIYLSDSTFNIMVDYYIKGLSQWGISQGNKVEQRAMDRSTSIIVSSDWAKDSVLNDYHQPASKVHVVEFGANIEDNDIIQCSFRYEQHLDLLFLGVDWQRKGGDIAVAACKWLNEHDISSTLHVVGIKQLDEKIKSLPYINYIGFLNKNVPEQYDKLVETIAKCHCLLLPTLAECAGIAFCESSANGLPVFSHMTGGVGNYVLNGRNGYLLPLGSTGEDFGKKIKECLENGELEKMSETARDVYREKLNWRVWSEKVEQIIKDILR